jgi:Fusaric acid resistance protein-like
MIGTVAGARSGARATWPPLRRAVENVRANIAPLRLADPGLVALKSAARAAIVMPAVFAFADKVIQNQQTATFAAFGSFAMLVLVDFTGPARSRFVAYVVLALAGAANIVLGTFCSRNAWLAAAAMALVGFVILFSGVINGYFAAAGSSAMLTFVLPVTLRAPFSAVPDRLEGWALAAVAGTCAHMLLWPPRPHDTLRDDAARACTALADLAEPDLPDDPSAIESRAQAARDAVDGFRRRLLTAPHRPSGPTGPTAALASLADELDWLLLFLGPRADPASLDLCREENLEAMAATAAVLRAAAATLAGSDERPDFRRLADTREAVAQALARRISQLPRDLDDARLGSALEPAFRIRVISGTARQVAGYALLASGVAVPELDDLDLAGAEPTARPRRAALQATERLAVEDVSARSIWFRNSIRGAAGLAIAVYIAQRSGLQHAFWVVLGTLSVLRSNALGTGWSVLSALAGTAIGILVGAALVIAIGTHEAILWAALPVAVLLAAYAPRAISFAAGQAGFTVVLFVLFNLIQPTGWRVGVVRIEDVAIGFAISLGVGLLFWPRGAARLLRENLAFAYGRSADYVADTARQIIAGGGRADLAGPAQAAAAAVHRLDDAFRQYLAERSARRENVESVGALVAGAARVRRAGQSLSDLGRMTEGQPSLARCGENLDEEIYALRSWYVTLGDSFLHSTATPPPHIRDAEGRRRLLECVREAVAGGDDAQLRPALVLLWTSQHLDNLWRLESHLGRAAAEASRRPE